MNEQKNNGRGVFYGVIGVATLVVAIIGATFAYFTATASNNATITGNMATINFGLVVDQVTSADDNIGMIPMSNSMVHAAVTNASTKGICKDNNGNVVCQVYRATVTNTGSAALYLDGYVSLYGGSGAPTDKGSAATYKTTMRWAQVLCTGDEDGEVDTCTTIGVTPTGAGLAVDPEDEEASGITENWATLASADQGETTDPHNANNVLLTGATVTTKASIAGSNYDIINRNYIRISDHAEGDPTYDREDDVTSALVFNMPLAASNNTDDKDVAKLYFVVWLSETGTNQTADSDGVDAFESTDAGKGVDFFRGDVVFNSAQGSEVTATFAGFATVQSDAVNNG